MKAPEEGTLLWLVILSLCTMFAQCEHVSRHELRDELQPMKERIAVQQVQIDSLEKDVARPEQLERERRWPTP
jgi:hypothetical protein